MAETDAPIIKPYKTKDYKIRQSKYEVVGTLPTRTILLAASNSGKTVLLTNFILNIYRDCWDAVYIFSPSIHLDDNWAPVKEYLDKRNKVGEKIYFDEYNPGELMCIVDSQEKVVNYGKQNKHNKLFQIAVFIDDFADSPTFSRSSKILHSLFTRGRHKMISTFVSTQKFSALHPIIRVNASSYIVFKLKNYQDLELFLTELGALLRDKQRLFRIYKEATEEPYSFLYCDLMARDINKLFYLRFERPIEVESYV
jgi:hypothetical protein